jgi:SAM-dependent methyltransferase
MGGSATRQAHPSNREQLRAWDGDEGAFWAEHAERFDRAVAEHHAALMDAAAVGPADRVLDVGCGAGQTSLDAARAAAGGAVLGVDLSRRMLQVARRRAQAQRLEHVRFEQRDAQVHRFPEGGFDLVISRTGTMFFDDPVTAFRNLASALRHDGRLVMAVWQPVSENEWFREVVAALSAGRPLPVPPPDAPGPFSLADPDRARRILSSAGFVDPSFTAHRGRMRLGEDAEDAHAFVSTMMGWMLDDLDAPRRARALADLRGSMRAHQTADGVFLGSATWLVTATAP